MKRELNQPLEELIFEVVVEEVHKLFDLWPDTTEDNFFEGCILGCYIGIDRIRREKHINSTNFELKVFSVVERVAKGTSIYSRLPCRFPDYIAKRLKTCDDYYLTSEYSAKNALALSRITFQLYVVALESEGQCEAPELLEFANERIEIFFNAIHSSIDIMLFDM